MNAPGNGLSQQVRRTLYTISENYALTQAATQRRSTFLQQQFPQESDMVTAYTNKDNMRKFTVTAGEKRELSTYLSQVQRWFQPTELHDRDTTLRYTDAINAYTRNDLRSIQQALFVDYGLHPERLGQEEIAFILAHTSDLNEVAIHLDRAPFEIGKDHGQMALMESRELRDHLEGEIRRVAAENQQTAMHNELESGYYFRSKEY